MNPLLRTFLRLTVLITGILVAIWLLGMLFHVVIVAAIVAALVMGGLFLYNAVRRRSGVPVIRR